MDTGKSREDELEIYRGLPFGIKLSINLSEHDEGDPEKYRDEVGNLVDKAGDAVADAIGAIPVVGTALSVAATIGLASGEFASISDKVNELLGTDDDFIGGAGLDADGQGFDEHGCYPGRGF